MTWKTFAHSYFDISDTFSNQINLIDFSIIPNEWNYSYDKYDDNNTNSYMAYGPVSWLNPPQWRWWWIMMIHSSKYH